MTAIKFEVVDAPTTPEKDITTNPYWPLIEAIKDLDGKQAKFAVPMQEGDDFKKATGRVRSKLNEISDHIKRTIRASFTETNGKIVGAVWVMDRKITKNKKTDEKPTTPADEKSTTPADEKPTAPVNEKTTAAPAAAGNKARVGK